MDERTTQLMHTAMGAGFSEAFMDDVGDESLEHYGRLGMKWYKHIFGDKDERAAYSNGGKGKNQTDDSSASKKKSAVEVDPEEEAAVREALKQEYLKDPRKVMQNKEMFTTQELQQAVNRFTVEDNLARIVDARYTKGQSAVDKFMEIAEKGANTLNSANAFTKNAATFYNNAAVIYNSLSGDDKKKLPLIKESKQQSKEEREQAMANAYKAKLQAQQEEDKMLWAREDRARRLALEKEMEKERKRQQKKNSK